MANRFPLIVDSVNLNLKELPSGDNLDLQNSNIINVDNITLSGNGDFDLGTALLTNGYLTEISNVSLADTGFVNMNYGSINNLGNLTTASNTVVILNTSSVVVNAIGNTETYANLNLASFNYFTATANTNTTFQFQNTYTGNVGVSFVLELANGGDHTITWPTTVRWPSNTAPTLSTTGNTDMFVFFSENDGALWKAAYQLGYLST